MGSCGSRIWHVETLVEKLDLARLAKLPYLENEYLIEGSIPAECVVSRVPWDKARAKWDVKELAVDRAINLLDIQRRAYLARRHRKEAERRKKLADRELKVRKVSKRSRGFNSSISLGKSLNAGDGK